MPRSCPLVLWADVSAADIERSNCSELQSVDTNKKHVPKVIQRNSRHEHVMTHIIVRDLYVILGVTSRYASNGGIMLLFMYLFEKETKHIYFDYLVKRGYT